MAIAVFVIFVGIVLAISSYTSRRARGVGGYFVAHGSVPWMINGIAFAGGYLSVASFLGICGLIAFFGYDGFLYSIGFLAGWIIALFVIAEPMKRRGTFTFPDALNSTFKHPGIQLAAGLSVLVVSLFYLIPQMVGAGVLVEPLLGIPHHWGVIIVGGVVILIVASGGMTSTTWVQFFNGGLLLIFASVLTVAVLLRGVNTADRPLEEGVAGLESYRYTEVAVEMAGDDLRLPWPDARVVGRHAVLDRYSGAESEVFYRVSRLIPAIAEDTGGYTANIKERTPYFAAETGQARRGRSSRSRDSLTSASRIGGGWRPPPMGRCAWWRRSSGPRFPMARCWSTARQRMPRIGSGRWAGSPICPPLTATAPALWIQCGW